MKVDTRQSVYVFRIRAANQSIILSIETRINGKQERMQRTIMMCFLDGFTASILDQYISK